MAVYQSIRSSKKIIANRYKVKKEIFGGMGVIYLCTEIYFNDHPVVLKTCQPKYADDKKVRAQFLREAATWVEIGWHPNIVQAYRTVYDYASRELYLVIEMVPPLSGEVNPTLRSLLMQGKSIDLEEALPILIGVARGMKYATTKIPGLIHCDLKPENIFIGADGRACVSDFGLVSTPKDAHEKLSDSSQRYVNTRSRPIGSPHYMSPERWRNRKVSFSSDIYALGCIFFEMLTGDYAIKGCDIKSIIEGHIRGDPLRKSKEMYFPNEIADFFRKCLEPDPRKRFQTWEDLVSAVEKMHEVLLFQPAQPEITLLDVSQKSQEILGETLFSIGEAYLDILEVQAAMVCFAKAKTIGKLQNYHRLVAQSEANIGLACFMLHQPERGIAHFRRATTHQDKVEDHEYVDFNDDIQVSSAQTRQFN